MDDHIAISPGQWVLACERFTGPIDTTLAEHLERFAFHHWMDTTPVDDLLAVLQVDKVMPNTFTAKGGSRQTSAGQRLPRAYVVASFETEAEAVALRDKLFGIGDEAGRKIEAEMYRRVEKFAEREKAKALKKIHRALPQIFGRELK
ncbi:hypothetical protein ACQKP1_15925 [Allorhizobium sp. NPDC080224]|uniref:hypothetical protein n=1 Tax=Allorhizobium sp. NPDC080224 TaxID=3390547 RepID=UPI003D051F85